MISMACQSSQSIRLFWAKWGQLNGCLGVESGDRGEIDGNNNCQVLSTTYFSSRNLKLNRSNSTKFCLSLFVLRYIIFTLIDNLRGVKRETIKMLGEWNSFSLSAIRDSLSICQHVFVICFFILLWRHKLYQRSLPTMFFTTLIMKKCCGLCFVACFR